MSLTAHLNRTQLCNIHQEEYVTYFLHPFFLFVFFINNTRNVLCVSGEASVLLLELRWDQRSAIYSSTVFIHTCPSQRLHMVYTIPMYSLTWKKYIYLSSVLKYNLEAFLLLLFRGKYTFIPLHLFVLVSFQDYIENTKYRYNYKTVLIPSVNFTNQSM